MNKQTFSFLPYPNRAKKNKKGLAPIIVRITVNGERAEFSLKRYINPNQWNSQKNLPIDSSDEHTELKNLLNQKRTQVYTIQRDLEDHGKPVTAKSIVDRLSGRDKKQKKLFEIFDEHNRELEERSGIDFAPGTVQKYKACRSHVQGFINKKYRTEDIFVQQINHGFVKGFEHYLKTERSCGQNTTIKYLQNLKKIVRIALANDWLKVDPFRNIKLKKEEVEIQYLNDRELEILRNIKFGIARMDQVKDIFLFCCFTGLAYSDVKDLSIENIQTGIDTSKIIVVKRKKTKRVCRIPLLPVSQDILRKYEDQPSCQISGKLLPVLSNQKMNGYLKEIFAACGINKNITTHGARHTFATTVALANGISLEVVSKMLGHSNIGMTQHYARILDKTVKNEMKKVEKKYSILGRLNYRDITKYESQN